MTSSWGVSQRRSDQAPTRGCLTAARSGTLTRERVGGIQLGSLDMPARDGSENQPRLPFGPSHTHRSTCAASRRGPIQA